MTFPSTLTAWLAHMRKQRRRDAATLRLLANLAAIQVQVRDISAAVAIARRQRTPRVALAYDLVRGTAGLIGTTISEDVLPDGPFSADLREERAALALTLRAIQRELHRLRFVEGLFLSQHVLPPNDQIRVVRGVRAVQVVAGDTLGTIAAREMGRRDRWEEIAALNDLDYPYIGSPADYPERRIAAPGSDLLIPVEGVGAGPTLAAPTQVDLFGIDLDLSTTIGQITFANGDAELIAGPENVQQAVRHRVTSRFGDLPLHPTYGSLVPTWVGHLGTPETVQLATFDFLRAVAAEPRIRKVDRKSAKLDGVTLHLSADAIVIGTEKPLKVNVIVPSLGGG